MNVFISIDMEGICGIVGELETDPIKGGEAYQADRRLMTQEDNAAIKGCVKAGATDVQVVTAEWLGVYDPYAALLIGRAYWQVAYYAS